MKHNPALPPEPEVEVIYQSWDPPSGGFYLYVEGEKFAGEWTPVTYGQWAESRGREMRNTANYDRPVVWPDEKGRREDMKRLALRFAERTGNPTRVIRRQALL